MPKELHVVSGGGTRSESAPPFHLVPRAGIRRTALRFGLGAEKHGDYNWLESCDCEEDAAEWANEAYNHMMEHALKMSQQIEMEDDHLGAIGWAQSVLCYLEERYNKPWTQLGVPEEAEGATRWPQF